MSSTIGKIFRLTTFGESHGPAVGGVIDGIPSGFEIDFDKINLALEEESLVQVNFTAKEMKRIFLSFCLVFTMEFLLGRQ